MNLDQPVINQQLKKSLSQLQNSQKQDETTHKSIVKMINLRTKAILMIKRFLQQKQNIIDIKSCLRLLNNQQNISILNDGVTYLVDFVVTQQKITLQKKIALLMDDLEQNMVQLLGKLIMSKYESHVQNALEKLININQYFDSTFSDEHYQKIIQSKRVKKLLNQQKKKKLFELAYSLSMRVAGPSFLNELK